MARGVAEPLVHLVVIAKSPVPGKVKTRLCPPFSLEQAALIAEAALRDTLTAVAATPAAARTIALEGPVGPWLPESIDVIAQHGEGLDERLANAFDDAERRCPAPLLLVGMDTPQLTPALLTAAAHTLVESGAAVLGPATDGGWWALGLQRANRRLLVGVPTSTPRTCEFQARRLRDHGIDVTLLDTLVDVDDADSATQVSREAPNTEFARTLADVLVAR
jgi:hypothetical protein